MRQGPPTIVKAAERLLVEIERAVCAFPRKHRYQLGNDLRGEAVAAVLLCQEAYRANSDKARQAVLVEALTRTVEIDTKASMRNIAAKEIKNSERSGIRARQHRGFFVPGHLFCTAGRATDTTLRKGKEVRRLRSVLNLPASSLGCVRTAPRGFNELAQELIMTQPFRASPYRWGDFYRGTRDQLISTGLVKPEWFPGQPGNNKVIQTIILEPDHPRLIKSRGRSEKANREYTQIQISVCGKNLFCLFHRFSVQELREKREFENPLLERSAREWAQQCILVTSFRTGVPLRIVAPA